MGLYNTAFQTLSEMAINENGVDLPQSTSAAMVDELKAMLESMPALDPQDMVFSVQAVPIRESQKLGMYLIEMEDISRFMLTNGYSNILEAVNYVLKENGVYDGAGRTALVIDEASILDEITDLGYDVGSPDGNPTGLGKGLLGPHTDIDKFRKFANSKELIDQISNRYGLPVVKKNYTVGLVKEAAEQVYVKKKSPTDQVLQEKPTDIDKKSGASEPANINEEENVIDDPHTAYIKYLREVADGKYDMDDEIIDETTFTRYYVNEAKKCGNGDINKCGIPNYGKDHSMDDAQDPNTFNVNIPAGLSAKTAGGRAFPETITNGISNKFSPSVFSNKEPNRDGIPNYGKDHSMDDAQDPMTFKVNIPAGLSAKTAGGHPFPETVKNGISNKFNSGSFNLRKLYENE